MAPVVMAEPAAVEPALRDRITAPSWIRCLPSRMSCCARLSRWVTRRRLCRLRPETCRQSRLWHPLQCLSWPSPSPNQSRRPRWWPTQRPFLDGLQHAKPAWQAQSAAQSSAQRTVGGDHLCAHGPAKPATVMQPAAATPAPAFEPQPARVDGQGRRLPGQPRRRGMTTCRRSMPMKRAAATTKSI